MRQLCNIAYVAQAEKFDDEDAFVAWDADLDAAPGAPDEWKPPPTRVDDRLLNEFLPGPA